MLWEPHEPVPLVKVGSVFVDGINHDKTRGCHVPGSNGLAQCFSKQHGANAASLC